MDSQDYSWQNCRKITLAFLHLKTACLRLRHNGHRPFACFTQIWLAEYTSNSILIRTIYPGNSSFTQQVWFPMLASLFTMFTSPVAIWISLEDVKALASHCITRKQASRRLNKLHLIQHSGFLYRYLCWERDITILDECALIQRQFVKLNMSEWVNQWIDESELVMFRHTRMYVSWTSW